MRNIALMLLTIFSLQALSQEYKIVQHNVKLGETVRMLSKKYHVAPSDIYSINKFAINGITQGMVLQIPVEVKEVVAVKEFKDIDNNQEVENPEVSVSEVSPRSDNEQTDSDVNEIKHQVEKGETLFSLSKKYSISVAELKNQNEVLLTKGLQSGQVLTIRNKK